MFTKLVELNNKHFNDHPVVHIGVTMAYGMAAGLVLKVVLPKIAGADTGP